MPKAKRVADLFCGAGAFTFPLLHAARVDAFDSQESAIEALKKAHRNATRLKPVDARVRDLMREPLSPLELKGYDAVVFDPPRAGAEQQSRMLARALVPLVVAVSCNPATFARDARILVDGGYRMTRVRPVDQFRWSSHVEVVATFARSERARK
jgi:23S rRNA (uracil1939-C5)-methyltransferase